MNDLTWFFTSGAYEVVWSLYITSIGGTIELVGLTFAAFAFPVLILGPIAGRFIDQRGGYVALLVGMGVATGCGPIYPIIPEVWFVVLLGLVEGAAFALGSPALFALVARAWPARPRLDGSGHLRRGGHDRRVPVASVSAGESARSDRPSLPVWSCGVAAAWRGLAGLTPLLAAGRDLPPRPRADKPSEASAPRIPAVRLTTTRSVAPNSFDGSWVASTVVAVHGEPEGGEALLAFHPFASAKQRGKGFPVAEPPGRRRGAGSHRPNRPSRSQAGEMHGAPEERSRAQRRRADGMCVRAEHRSGQTRQIARMRSRPNFPPRTKKEEARLVGAGVPGESRWLRGADSNRRPWVMSPTSCRCSTRGCKGYVGPRGVSNAASRIRRSRPGPAPG